MNRQEYDRFNKIHTNKQTSYKIKKKTNKKIKLKNTRNKMNMNGEKVTYYLIYVIGCYHNDDVYDWFTPA